jgi:hypothetical protein
LRPSFFLRQPVLANRQSSQPNYKISNRKKDVHVIVEYDHDPSDSDHQRIVHRGGHYRHALHSVRGGSYLLPSSAVADLANDSSVTHVSIDPRFGPSLITQQPPSRPPSRLSGTE